MKVYSGALALLGWLAQRESAPVSEITASGLKCSQDASDVIRTHCATAPLRAQTVQRPRAEELGQAVERYQFNG